MNVSTHPPLTTNQLNQNLQKLLQEVDEKYTHFEETEDLQLDSLEQKFRYFSQVIRENKFDQNQETSVLLEKIKGSLGKLSSAFNRYRDLLNHHQQEIKNQSAGFKAYVDSFYLEP